MIRDARVSDIPALIRLGALFHGEINIADIAPYDPESCIRILQGHIDNPLACVLVSEAEGRIIGVIGGCIVPIWWNFNLQAAQQMYYFVERSSRSIGALKLFTEWESRMKDKGATIIFTGHKLKYPAMGKYLERRGYAALETMYVKGV